MLRSLIRCVCCLPAVLLAAALPACSTATIDSSYASEAVGSEARNAKDLELLLAVRRAPLEEIQRLLDRGADPNAVFTEGPSSSSTALMGAATFNPDERVTQLLIDAGAEIDRFTVHEHAEQLTARHLPARKARIRRSFESC